MNIFKRLSFLIVLMCAACNLSQQTDATVTSTAAPAPVDTPAAELNLTTYTNTAYGYTIQYPVGLELEGSADSQFVWLDRQIYIVVNEVDPEKPMGDGPVIDIAQDTMIGTNTARYLGGYIGAVGGNTPQRYDSFVIAHNNLYYQFIAYELKRDDVQPIDRTMAAVPAAEAELLQQIVTSVRFTS